jgi:adenylate cyclase
MEIERKWLVIEAPQSALAAPGELIEQGYLVVAPDGSETRVRRRGERRYLTAKSGGGLVRAEHEIELTEAQFEVLWPATEGRRVTKVRHVLGEIELDVYGGTLAGLIVAEVEFQDEATAHAFTPPTWFGTEVTSDSAYKNQRLALDGRP